MQLGGRAGTPYTDGMSACAIARLKIILNDVEPTVLRRIEVPLALQLDRLHLTIQAAMGWTNSHLYKIRAGDFGWGVPDPDWGGGLRDARKAKLLDVLEEVGTKSLCYLYDFGDGWEHTIKVEQLIDSEPGAVYPPLIEGSVRCPPEDIGGPWGYAELLAAIDNPDHERHADLNDWIETNFDPRNAHAEALAGEIHELAKKWSRKARSKAVRAP